MANLTGLRTLLRNRLGVPSNDSFYTDAAVDGLINSALQYISAEQDWYWLELSESIATVASQDSYTTNATSLRTIGVFDSTGVPLQKKNYDELLYMGTATGTTIRFFSMLGSKIVVRSIPSGIQSLTHVYVGVEPALVSGTDTPLMPSQYHETIAEYAAYLAETRAGNTQIAQAHLDVYNRWVAIMKSRADRYADSHGGGDVDTGGK